MEEMNLSPNFTLEELVRSAKASELGYAEQFQPSEIVVINLTLLCKFILQPLREIVGPIKVSSGYRCYRVNKAVGGAANSQHLLGQAADLQATGAMTNAQLFKAIVDAKLPFDQLIEEYPDENGIPQWVHVSYSNRKRGQVITVR